MSNNDNFNESNYFNKSIESTQSKESKNYKKSAAYKFAVGVLALSLTVGTLTGCGGDKINATEVTTTQVEDYTDSTSAEETSSESSENTNTESTSGSATSNTVETTTETNTSVTETTEATTEVTSAEQNFESMYTFKYELPTLDNLTVPSRFSNGELVDYTHVPRTAAEDYNFKYLNPEQQAEIKKMADMSVEDFRALPQEEQLTYAYWLFENNYQSLELLFDIAKIDRDYKWEVKDAYDIVNNYACGEIFWRTLLISNPDSSDRYDYDAMKKFGSLLYSPELLNKHDNLVEEIRTNSSTPDDCNIRLTEADYVDPKQLPLIEDVEIIPINVTFEPSELVGIDELVFVDFKRVEFTTITGEEASAFVINSFMIRK